MSQPTPPTACAGAQRPHSAGLDADLTLFTLKRQPTVLTDAENDSLQAEHILMPLAAIRAGKGYMTEQGSTEHAFDL